MSYLGNQPKTTTFLIDQFDGDNSEVNFTLQTPPASLASILVFISGVRQSVESYTLNLSQITFDSPPASGTKNIEVVHITQGMTAAVPTDSSVTDAKLTVTGVTAGTYGDEGNIPIIAVNEKGRVTSVANVSVNIPEAGINPLLFTGT
tara:strand:+ start:104 stop:547 length:444 start_codon:yes stop_codon:yes gene_type:complete